MAFLTVIDDVSKTAITRSGEKPHWIATSAASRVVIAINSDTAMP